MITIAKITSEQDNRRGTIEAGDTIEIRVNGNVVYSRTINTGYDGIVDFTIQEKEIVA